MALLDPVNNMGNNPLVAVQDNVFVNRENNLGNNPLGAIQPNVLANVLPMPNELRVFLIGRISDRLHDLEAERDELDQGELNDERVAAMDDIQGRIDRFRTTLDQIQAGQRISRQDHVRAVAGWINESRNPLAPQWREYFRAQYPEFAAIFQEPVRRRRFFNNGSTLSANSNNSNDEDGKNDDEEPAAVAPFSPEELALMRQAVNDEIQFYIEALQRDPEDEDFLGERQRFEAALRELDAGRLPVDEDLREIGIMADNPELQEHIDDYRAAQALGGLRGIDRNAQAPAPAPAAAPAPAHLAAAAPQWLAQAPAENRNARAARIFRAGDLQQIREELQSELDDINEELQNADEERRLEMLGRRLRLQEGINDIEAGRFPDDGHLWDLVDMLDDLPIGGRIREFLEQANAENAGNNDENADGKEDDEEAAVPRKTIEEAKAILDVPPAAPVTELPQHVATIEQKLEDCFYEGYNQHVAAIAKGDFLPALRQLLIDNEAVIAGGFLLNALGLYPESSKQVDLDVYVPCRHLKGFNLVWAKILNASKISQFQSTHYCKSFLRKNGIRSVQKLRADAPISPECPTQEVDIMGVRNRRPVTEVVKNFDLTFCQIWYDGRNVFATHPTHIDNKVGLLQKDYVRTFLAGNTFLKYRLHKYQERGFRVLLDKAGLDKLEDSDLTVKKYRSGNRRDPISWRTKNPRYSFSTSVLNTKEYSKLDRSSDEFLDPLLKHYLLEYLITGELKLETHKTRPYTGMEMNIGAMTNTETSKTLRVGGVGKGLYEGVPIGDLTTLEYLDPLDGYDSEDIDIAQDATITPLLAEGIRRGTLKEVGALRDLPEDIKVKNMLFRFVSNCTNPFMNVPPTNPLELPNIFLAGVGYQTWQGTPEQRDSEKRKMYEEATPGYPEKKREDWGYPIEVAEKFNEPNTVKYIEDKLFTFPITTAGMDVLTLDDVDRVYHLHQHSTDDAIGIEGLKEYLEGKRQQPNKDVIPCYASASGCTLNLTMSEIHAICKAEGQVDWYLEFAKYVRPMPNTALGEHIIDRTEGQPDRTATVQGILQDTKMATDNWGEQYHITMCPFCLSYIGRESGCIYVQHADSIGGITQMPKCIGKNLVTELFERYTTEGRRIFQEDRTRLFVIPGLGPVYPGLEVCVECGRPCLGHFHFDLQPRMGILRPLNAAGGPVYDRCPGGGRRELLARVLAVRQTQRANPGMDPAELHRRCALAADAAWNNQDLLAKADLLLARPVERRRIENLNIVIDGRPFPLPNAPPRINDEEAPLGAIGNVFVGGLRSDQKRPVGKPMLCQHGYGDGYKGRLEKTAKRRQRVKKGTRKV